jgi:ssDNA thymidine ADP-ribosyltransferase, DarT
MSRPIPTRIFHITPIANLAEICRLGRLICKNDLLAAGAKQVSIAHQSIQDRRAQKIVEVVPGGTVHDYVPFYFAPRSPMLSAILHGRVENCQVGQEDIVHVESSVELVVASGRQFVVYPISAAYAFGVNCFNTLDGLDEIKWPLFFEAPRVGDFAKYFMSRLNPPQHAQRMETRQAEFLVHKALSLSHVTRLGVASDAKQQEVCAVLNKYGVKLPVDAITDWYFFDQ